VNTTRIIKEVCHNPDNFDFVCSGRYYDYTSGEDYIKTNYDELGPSRHFTYVFNIFIWFQLFNEINSRKIRDEVWTFEGLGRAPMFVIIWFITAGLQVLIVQVGYRAFEVNKYGLTVEQWFTCIAWGLIPLVWRFILLLIPGFKKMHIKEPAPPKSHLSSLLHKGSANSRKLVSASYKF
jgi:Cation transport ATPase